MLPLTHAKYLAIYLRANRSEMVKDRRKEEKKLLRNVNLANKLVTLSFPLR